MHKKVCVGTTGQMSKEKGIGRWMNPELKERMAIKEVKEIDQIQDKYSLDCMIFLKSMMVMWASLKTATTA